MDNESGASTTTTHIADTIVAGRRLADFTEIRDNLGHRHGNDMLVGYVVRETIRGGEILWHGGTDEHGRREHCGYDVTVVEGGRRYADTFPSRDAYRATEGGYAVVDYLYSCGCRSAA